MSKKPKTPLAIVVFSMGFDWEEHRLVTKICYSEDDIKEAINQAWEKYEDCEIIRGTDLNIEEVPFCIRGEQ